MLPRKRLSFHLSGCLLSCHFQQCLVNKYEENCYWLFKTVVQTIKKQKKRRTTITTLQTTTTEGEHHFANCCHQFCEAVFSKYNAFQITLRVNPICLLKTYCQTHLTDLYLPCQAFSLPEQRIKADQ